MSPDEKPVADNETLLRRVASDSAKFIFPNGPFVWNALLPNPNDDDGLSLNREGSDYIPSPERLLELAENPNVRLYGGVIGITAAVFRSLGVEPVPNPQTSSPGHCLIKEMSRTIYDGSRAGKRQIQTLAQRLAEQAVVRKAPSPIPPR